MTNQHCKFHQVYFFFLLIFCPVPLRAECHPLLRIEGNTLVSGILFDDIRICEIEKNEVSMEIQYWPMPPKSVHLKVKVFEPYRKALIRAVDHYRLKRIKADLPCRHAIKVYYSPTKAKLLRSKQNPLDYFRVCESESGYFFVRQLHQLSADLYREP